MGMSFSHQAPGNRMWRACLGLRSSPLSTARPTYWTHIPRRWGKDCPSWLASILVSLALMFTVERLMWCRCAGYPLPYCRTLNFPWLNCISQLLFYSCSLVRSVGLENSQPKGLHKEQENTEKMCCVHLSCLFNVSISLAFLLFLLCTLLLLSPLFLSFSYLGTRR